MQMAVLAKEGQPKAGHKAILIFLFLKEPGLMLLQGDHITVTLFL